MQGYASRVRRVLYVALALNLLVAVGKLLAGWQANSLSVVGDGLHSGVDALANVLALGVLRFSTRPADVDHPFGHGRYETLAAFVASGILLVTAFELGRSAFLRFLDPQPTSVTGITVAVMVVTLLVNVGVSWYETRAGRRERSEILLADAAQTRADVYVSLAVIVGLLLGRLGYPRADGLFAVGVAFAIAFAGWRVVRDVLPILTDRIVFEPAVVARVVEQVPGVVSVHDIRSRGAPREAYVQLHLVVDRDDVQGAHAIADEVERRLSRELGVKETLVHIEPEDDDSGPPGTRGGARAA